MPPTALIRRLGAAWGRFGIERRCAKGTGRAGLERVKRLGSPSELLALLAWHDGSRGREIDGYYRFLSCAEIVRHKRRMDTLVPHFEGDWMPGDWWSVAWIPFLECNGDLIALDAEGKVVSVQAYDSARPLLYRSFGDWLATLVEIWEQMPEAASEDAQIDFFASRAATRLRRNLNPGYPLARRARKRPAEKRPKAIEHV